jgi:hypothetical protein
MGPLSEPQMAPMSADMEPDQPHLRLSQAWMGPFSEPQMAQMAQIWNRINLIYG